MRNLMIRKLLRSIGWSDRRQPTEGATLGLRTSSILRRADGGTWTDGSEVSALGSLAARPDHHRFVSLFRGLAATDFFASSPETKFTPRCTHFARAASVS